MELVCSVSTFEYSKIIKLYLEVMNVVAKKELEREKKE